MKYKYILITALLSLTLTACSSSGSQAVTEEEAATFKTSRAASTEAAPESEPAVITYIDENGQQRTMTVDGKVKATQFDKAKFSRDHGGDILYDDDSYRVIKGLDVSEHQGDIDWEGVRIGGCEFTFVRVGYRTYGDGKIRRDANAVTNLQEAKKENMYIGAYFFSQAVNEQEAREEADLAADVIKEAGVDLDLPVMFDPETILNDSGRINGISRAQATANVKAFCEEIEKNSGLQAGVYCNLDWEQSKLDMESLDTYPIWYADYAAAPQTPYSFTWWQYTDSGTAYGILGDDVDLDCWIVPESEE